MGRSEEFIAQRLQGLRDQPVRFVREVCFGNPAAFQVLALRLLATRQKVAIAGARGVGKDHLAAWAIWWFLATRYFPKVICTAVNEATIKDNLWATCSKVWRQSPILQAMFEIQDNRIICKFAPEEWFAAARVAARQGSGGTVSAQGIAGRYADDTLSIADEASDIHDAILDALEGGANTPRRKLLYLLNPVRREGRAADAFLKEEFRRSWATMNVGYLDSPFSGGIDPGEVLTEEQAKERQAQREIREDWIRKHGKDSVFVQAFVYGRFPSTSSVDRVFSYSELDEARNRVVEDNPSLPVIVGVDVARFGNDRTVWYVRRGWKTLAVVWANKTSGPFVVGKAVELARAALNGTLEGWDGQLVERHPDFGTRAFDPRDWVEFRVDETGVGGSGVVDPLRDYGWSVAGVNNGSKASAELRDQYYDFGSELWMEDAKLAVQWCDIPPIYEDLFDELQNRQYKFLKGLKKLVSKDEMRSRGIRSPDLGDAFVLAFADSDKLDLGPVEMGRDIAIL